MFQSNSAIMCGFVLLQVATIVVFSLHTETFPNRSSGRGNPTHEAIDTTHTAYNIIVFVFLNLCTVSGSSRIHF